MGTTAVNCGVFVADNYIGTFTFDNVVFWGGLFGLRIHPDVGGDQYVSLKDVYFVGPFAYGEFNFGDVAGHVVHFTKWENVRHATIVSGVLVPGALIPCPGTVEPGTPTNHAPVAATQSLSTTTGVAKAIVLTANDADGDAVTYAIAAPPTHGTLSGSGANRTYTPTAGFTGSDHFTFTASDGTATSAAATVAITIAAPPAGTGHDGHSDSGSGHRCGLGSGLATVSGLLLGLLLTLRRRHESSCAAARS
ncbi:MAG TPA: Ig-like domain-containing protein [Planctomycetota bacterium]|nr:Ig-like domain-containing protein [Planctomycetota bacterium]